MPPPSPRRPKAEQPGGLPGNRASSKATPAMATQAAGSNGDSKPGRRGLTQTRGDRRDRQDAGDGRGRGGPSRGPGRGGHGRAVASGSHRNGNRCQGQGRRGVCPARTGSRRQTPRRLRAQPPSGQMRNSPRRHGGSHGRGPDFQPLRTPPCRRCRARPRPRGPPSRRATTRRQPPRRWRPRPNRPWQAAGATPPAVGQTQAASANTCRRSPAADVLAGDCRRHGPRTRRRRRPQPLSRPTTAAFAREAAAEPAAKDGRAKPVARRCGPIQPRPSAAASTGRPAAAPTRRTSRDGRRPGPPTSARPTGCGSCSGCEQAFQSMSDRGGTVRLKLSPPELGSMRLEITVRNGALTARARDGNARAARNMLLDNLPAPARASGPAGHQGPAVRTSM